MGETERTLPLIGGIQPLALYTTSASPPIIDEIIRVKKITSDTTPKKYVRHL